MRVFPPRTDSPAKDTVVKDSAASTNSTEQLETGHLLWEAVDTALSQLSIEYNDDFTAGEVSPPLLMPPSAASTSRAICHTAHDQQDRLCPVGAGRLCAATKLSRGGGGYLTNGDPIPIPILFPLGWSKQGSLGGGLIGGDFAALGRKKPGTGAGVNHLNLIQIMGRTAHAWQPYLCQDPYQQCRSSVIRPELRTAELNWILLKREMEDPRKKR
jgi:hypothetical protein